MDEEEILSNEEKEQEIREMAEKVLEIDIDKELLKK